MPAEAFQEWLEPLDWIEPDAPVDGQRSHESAEGLSDLGVAAWSRLLDWLRSAASIDSAA
jgi:hypothetical protein